MNNYEEKIDKNLFSLIGNIRNPKILELGVQNGVSTKKFINLCEKNDGYLYAVDVEDLIVKNGNLFIQEMMILKI